MKKPNNLEGFLIYIIIIVHIRFSFILRYLFLFLIFIAISQLDTKAQDSFSEETTELAFAFDDIPVLVMLEGYPNFYLDVIYGNNNVLYVNVQELFFALQISCIAGENRESLSGFIGEENLPYMIDYNKKQVSVGKKTINIKKELVNENGTLYMDSDLFGQLFGLALTFNFRSLTMILKSDFEPPVIKQQRLEDMRHNIAKLQGVITADTSIQRNYHFFKPGVIDWSAASYQTWGGQTDNRFSLGLGAELLYGEANFAVDYYDKYEFSNRQLHYLWRWVDNDKSLIKQAQLGHISNNTISFINAPVVGGVIRNAPTTLRKAEGYYTISDFTEPDWNVELYINNILVDFTKADASGLYQFKIPIVYGYTTLKLKFYGPMGEERSEEKTMNVPYTVMPEGKFEYNLSAGIVQDGLSNSFGKADFDYGVNNFLTVGGGMEYLSSISTGAFIPYAKFTMQPFSKLTLYGEYAHGVSSRALLNYYFMKNSLLEIDYTKYVEGQQATLINALEQRKVTLSIPFRYKNILAFTKLDFTELVYNTFSYYQANAILSAYYRQFSANSSLQLNWIGNQNVFMTSDLAFSYRFGKGFTLRPSIRYNLNENNIISYKLALEKSIPRGNFSVSYERNVLYMDHFINLSFRYNLSFARASVSASHSNGKVYTSETIQGSLAFGSGNNYTYKSGNTALSKGGISLYPFLDLNYNGVFDEGENMVKLNSVRVMGSTAIINENDSIIRIPELNAFTKYIIQFSDIDLENIAWRFKYKSYEVLIDPNQFKRIDIPIISVGEVSGMVYRNINNSLKGIGRILINFYTQEGTKKVAETLSEYDGYMNFLGLEPGAYIACVDSVQLKNLGYASDKPQIAFTIRTMEDGDIVDGLDFIISSLDEALSELPNIQEDKAMAYFEDNITTVFDTLVHISPDTLYKVQLLALAKPLKGNEYFSKLLANMPDLAINEKLGEDSLYHYSTVMTFKGKAEAREFQRQLKESGWKDSFITIYYGEKRADKAFIQKLDQMEIKIDQSKSTIPIRVDPVKKEAAEKDRKESDKQQTIPIIKLCKITNDDLVEKVSLIRDSLLLMPNDTLYKIHLLALRVPIRVQGYFTRLQTDVPGISIEETLGDNGLYQYSTTAIRGMDQARELMQLIKDSGWDTCFLVTYTVEDNDEPIYKLKRRQSPKK